jgi:hypothetical protein
MDEQDGMYELPESFAEVEMPEQPENPHETH